MARLPGRHSYSGAATLWIAAAAEEWTVAALHRDKRWQLVNDLYLDQQIDHVAVGPKGILVVETKWAADVWDPDDRFMADRLQRSHRQAAAGRKKVEWWLRPKRHGAPVYGALVLWSPRGAKRASGRPAGCWAGQRGPCQPPRGVAF